MGSARWASPSTPPSCRSGPTSANVATPITPSVSAARTWPMRWTTPSPTGPRSSTCRWAAKARWAARSRPPCSVRSTPAWSSPSPPATRPGPIRNGRDAMPATPALRAASSSRAPTIPPIRSPTSPTARACRSPGSCRRRASASSSIARTPAAGASTAPPSPLPPWPALWPFCWRPSPI
ncbi:hypothetical protein D3C72_1163140 [compost metagenome]